MTTGTDSLEQNGITIYFCGEEDCAPSHFHGPAVRPHYLIHVVLSGKGIFRRGGITYHLAAGDGFLISPLESTYYQADDVDPWSYQWVGFDGFLVESMLSETGFASSCVLRFDAGTDIGLHILNQMNALVGTFRTPDYSRLTLTGHLYLLLGLMHSRHEAVNEAYTGVYYKKALEYMQNNYSYHIKIADIASSIGIDRTYLYRVFVEEEGISPKQYLHQLRLRMAAGMLRSPDYTITEISYSCGFKDAASFCNQFRRAFAMTPRQFRSTLIQSAKEI